jgi:glycosyltransferase involved in cell wall biosynthesis
MSAYNAARTLAETYQRIPAGVVRQVILVDDFSKDATADIATGLGIRVIRHPHNVGYGGNQKTCYIEALRQEADIVVMLHPDGQYEPEPITDLVRPIVDGRAEMVLGSRMLVPRGARSGGMPTWKRAAYRLLTTIENAVMGTRLSECHTGYRAYSATFLAEDPVLA